MATGSVTPQTGNVGEQQNLAERLRSFGPMGLLGVAIILAGALILWRAMEVLRFPEARISTRGLRFGVLRDSSKA